MNAGPLKPDKILLKSIKDNMQELKDLQRECDKMWGAEDYWYRFYHHSFKVYSLQSFTSNIVDVFQKIMPDRPLHYWFIEIVSEGTGHNFDLKHNEDWLRHTRPILEAYAHAKQFLDMMVKYGEQLDEAPSCLPSGWGMVLYLYKMRFGK